MTRLLFLRENDRILPINSEVKKWLTYDESRSELTDFIESHHPDCVGEDEYNIEINLLPINYIDPLHKDYRVENAIFANILWLLSEGWTIRLLDLRNYMKLFEYRRDTFTRMLTSRYVFELMSNPTEFLKSLKTTNFQCQLERESNLLKLANRKVELTDGTLKNVIFSELYEIPNRDYTLRDPEVKSISTSINGFVEPIANQNQIKFKLR